MDAQQHNGQTAGFDHAQEQEARTIVILQPQVFPWLGVFEQIACCDVFVHFDDVQLPHGRSFCTRVQIKTVQGVQWLSVPTLRRKDQTILETRTDDGTDWRRKHLATLGTAWAGYAHRDQALGLVEAIYRDAGDSLCEINIAGIERIAAYLGLDCSFARSSQMATSGVKDDLLLSILKLEGATDYVTGMGGLAYIDHRRFEAEGIVTHYMDYACRPYPQAHGAFTPYVSALDAIAACGPAARDLVVGRTRGWREALAMRATDTRTS